MKALRTVLAAVPDRLSALKREAAERWRLIMIRYGSILMTLAAVAVTALVVFLLWAVPRYQQTRSAEAPVIKAPIVMLNPERLSVEQRRKLNWILQIQNPALLTRGDHPHSYTALWKKQPYPSAVVTPDPDTPVFPKPPAASFEPLKSAAPEENLLPQFVPGTVAPPAAVKHSLPQAFDEKGRAVAQLRIEPVNKPVKAPTRLMLRRQGALVLPQILESCGVPDLDELAQQQVVSAMPRLGNVREITIYWNRKEEQL